MLGTKQACHFPYSAWKFIAHKRVVTHHKRNKNDEDDKIKRTWNKEVEKYCDTIYKLDILLINKNTEKYSCLNVD